MYSYICVYNLLKSAEKMPVGPVRSVNSGTSPDEWYKSLPLVTKILFTGTLISAAVVNFGIVDQASLILYWPLVKGKFEIWRLVTPFFFAGKFSFPFVMHLYMLYKNTLDYERNPFNTGAGGTSADVLFMLFFGMLCHVLLDVFVLGPYMVLSPQLLYMIVYLVSRKNPTGQANFFGIKVPLFYLPWVYVGLSILMGNDPMPCLIGILVGHIFYFFTEEFSRMQGYDLIRTPRFCTDLATWAGAPPANAGLSGTPSSFGNNSSSAGGTGFRWGRGRTLGS